MLAACGGSENKEENFPEETDSGIVIVADSGAADTDSGIVGDDASIVEDDAGIADAGIIIEDDAGDIDDDASIIIEDDASISEDDAGLIDDDAGIIDDDAGTDAPDAGPIEENDFISIPGGSFTLSHDTGSYSSGDTVTLAAFKLGKPPVTVAEFKKCVEAGKCTSEHYNINSTNSSCNYGDDSKADHPMNCVDWSGAKEYCEWIGGRLPTEEEWEYASTHNGTKHLNTTYPWGNDSPTSSTANYNENVGSTTEVGRYSPAGDSPLGLVDMAGNVWEWTESFFYSLGSSSRVLKGGSWVSYVYFLRVTDRSNDDPAVRSYNYGFRCAE